MSAVRIAIDGWELGERPTGVGRYLSALLVEWATLPEARAHRFAIYAPPSGIARLHELALDPASFEPRLVPGSRRTPWEQVSLARALRRDGGDLLFAPAYSAPLLSPLPVALTVHDVSFLAHPEWFRPRERWRRAWLTRLSCRRASVVLTVSAFSRDEIARYTGIHLDRVRVVAQGAPSPLIEPKTPPAGSAREDAVAGNPSVLFVGSILNRRRLPDLIRAFALVAASRPQARLDIVGEDRTYPRQDLEAVAAEAGVTGRVAFHRYVSEADLEACYRRASVFVFLSEYQGFGLTPLEAMAHGLPVVLLDTPVAREVFGDAAIYVRAGDLDGIAEAIVALSDDSRRVGQLVARGRALLAGYSWRRTAAETLEALVSAGQR